MISGKMKSAIILFFIVILIFVSNACQTKTPNEHYVVVLSLDGFRSDYSSKAHTPTLDSLARVGVKSSFRPSFPSLTFPNHYSMATGLYPDHHGIVSNSFYAPDLNKVYHTWNFEDITNGDFYGGEPIWITAEKQGIKSATFYWVGSETKDKKLQPSIWKKFDKKISFSNRADSVISWLALPEQQRPHLIMWYMEEPDHTGHIKGPDSPQIIPVIENLDKELNRFFTKARTLAIFDKIDFIIVSDHGMATYTSEQYIDLADYLPKDSFDHICNGIPALLYPKSSYLDSAYAKLKRIPHLSVWKKEEVPEKYAYGKNPRVGDLVVLPDVGNIILFGEDVEKINGGTHGYDTYAPEMEGIFYAAGPSFKKNITFPSMANVNLYPLIANLLDIHPAPNDGEEAIINQLLCK